MTRKRTLSGKKKLGLLIGSLALAGTGAGVLAATSNASTEGSAQSSTACTGLEQALANNEKFIADQQANPDAQSQARIANRQAVIEEIKRKQQASGCAVDDAAGQAEGAAGQDEAAAPAEGGASASASAPAGASDSGAGDAGASGEVVCAGSTVTLSGEGGTPAASSNEFPVGTKLKVTNLDNDKSTTVSVTSTSGSCALLNNAAFEQVREPGKFLIRNARIERVG
ncbi:hypothetical protein JK364_17640 [Streptomyces sp. 110]|uniref:Secreted protein n=1 Tax=Streptomyces endocoffeicus TaxID=2898945 RepID=A0ABS1PQH4_9ACTN|nr:hypothetical protein [Streptomyces endocoffeicus]MBL1114202.1 hypothetical protein [Streptomyces endocoffeicus]